MEIDGVGTLVVGGAAHPKRKRGTGNGCTRRHLIGPRSKDAIEPQQRLFDRAVIDDDQRRGGLGSERRIDIGIRGLGVAREALLEGSGNGTAGTLVVGGAGIAIVTGGAVGRILTTQGGMARIVGAGIPVITIQRGPRYANVAHAGFRTRTNTVVLAVRLRLAATRRRRTRRTDSGLARFRAIAGHAVRTGSAVGFVVRTTCTGTVASVWIIAVGVGAAATGRAGGNVTILTGKGWMAGIGGAIVGVVAIEWHASDTVTADAGIHRGAYAQVIARRRIIHIDTTRAGITGVVGAGIAVVAIQRRTARAGAARAGIVGCAGVAIAARSRVVDEQATGRRNTAVIGTQITVITGWCRPTYADSGTVTSVVRRASVSVTAR